jgi:hypothetical protein
VDERSLEIRKVMKIKQWMEKTKDIEQWRLVVEEAKVHPGLQSAERMDGWMELHNNTAMYGQKYY